METETDFDTRMVWVDIETTGLRTESCVPIELGLGISDSDGNLGDMISWVIHNRTLMFTQQLGFGASHEIVGPMHEKSGLWDDLADKSKTMKMRDVQSEALEWLDKHEIKYQTQPICGSSVGSLDRQFLQVFMPSLHNHFSHRNIDISSVKELCRRKNPRIYEKLSKYVTKRELHRVLPDIEDSAAEYVWYMDEFLICE